LRNPVKVIGAYLIPPPMAQSLEQENIPSPERVVATVKELLG